MKRVLYFLIFLLSISYCKSNIVTATGGQWQNNSTWDCNCQPTCGDTIVIPSGVTVEIKFAVNYVTCDPSYMLLVIDGTLDFQCGMNLTLPPNAFINLTADGLITGCPAGGSSNLLIIGNNGVWEAGDGDTSGPIWWPWELPIELLSFEANINEDKVDLKWITSAEINNDYFTIERSTDAINWEEVVSTKGAGNSNQLIEYFEIDYQPIEGISYYRLKQTDFDGKFSYFNVVPVKYVKNTNGIINLFPNPITTGKTVNVVFKNIYESELLVVLRNMVGKEFYSKVIVNIEDGKLIGIPIAMDVPKGIYLVIATSENQLYSQKLLIKDRNLANE
jgi:hypothetical protein